jgi:hypothetical protein
MKYAIRFYLSSLHKYLAQSRESPGFLGLGWGPCDLRVGDSKKHMHKKGVKAGRN